MKLVIYQQINGGIAIVFPTGEIPIEDVIGKDIPKEAPYMIIDHADLPSEFEFSSSWVPDFSQGSTVSVDMIKARDIWRDKMREKRSHLMAPLDVAFQRALETGASTADIVAKKQALRDVTKNQAIDAAQTIAELKSVWPDCLKVS
jgi:hypothetical protein